MDRLQGGPQAGSWHHECGHDCRPGLGCNVAAHYFGCRCYVIQERHVTDAHKAMALMISSMEWWGPAS